MITFHIIHLLFLLIIIMTILASDIGDEIYTGGRLSECHGDDNPCRAAMIDQVVTILAKFYYL